MTPQLKSAIIGYYRSGATMYEMRVLASIELKTKKIIDEDVINKIISDHDDKNNRVLKAGDMV